MRFNSWGENSDINNLILITYFTTHRWIISIYIFSIPQLISFKKGRLGTFPNPVIIQMKEAITNLGKDQTLQLQNLFADHHLDPPTATKAQKYYRELRKLNLMHTHNLTLDTLMKTSIVIAEQSQPICDLRGQKAGPLCMALNQMLYERSTVRGIMQGLKMYLLYSNRPNEQSLRADLSAVLNKIQFGLSYIVKFQKTIQYFDFVEVLELKNSRTDRELTSYLEVFKSFSWLFFLVMSKKIQTHEPFQSDYLLISVLYLMVRYVFDYLRPRSALRVGTNKDIISSILSQLFQIFEIDHPQSFKLITSKVDDLFERLIEDRTLRISEPYDFLSPKLIKINYKRIDTLYSCEHDPHELDYRLLLQNRESTLTPNKILKNTNIYEKVKGEVKRKSFASHKILNFEGDEVEETVPLPSKYNDIKIPQNVKISPSYIRTPLICVHQPSPNPSSIEHFMVRTVKTNKLSLNILQNEQEVMEMIRKVLSQQKSTRIKERVLLAYNYYLVLSQQYFEEEEWDEEDYNGIHCSSLVLSILFSLLAHQEDPELSSFVKDILKTLRSEISVNGYQLWLLCSFLKKNSEKPSILQQTLTILDDLILNELIWQQETSFLVQHYSLNENSQPTRRCLNFELLIAQILQRCQKIVSNILSSFDLQEKQIHFFIQITSILKQSIANSTSIMTQRHLYQILLTSVYLVFKEEHTNIRFNDIISHHQQVNNVNGTQLKQIVSQIEVDNQGQTLKVNIIHFYNSIFIPFFKQYHHRDEDQLIECFRKGQQSKIEMKRESQIRRARTQMSEGRSYQGEECLIKGEINSRNQSFAEIGKLSQKQEVLSSGGTRQQMRDETRLRARPSGGFMSNLKTEKVKSPLILR